MGPVTHRRGSLLCDTILGEQTIVDKTIVERTIVSGPVHSSLKVKGPNVNGLGGP